jgi:hypothetical protein
MTEDIAQVSAILLILIFTISLAVFKIMHTSHKSLQLPLPCEAYMFSVKGHDNEGFTIPVFHVVL